MARKDALLRLHQTLLARRAELRRRLGGELHDLGHDTNANAGDSADAAFETSGEEVSSQLAEIESRELQQVQRALMKLKQGTYGLCEGCNSRIPVLRLNALPYSTLCINCQREAENDSTWLASRQEANWEKVADDHDEPREVDLTDLEMDLSK